jgi:hypothetical protein
LFRNICKRKERLTVKVWFQKIWGCCRRRERDFKFWGKHKMEISNLRERITIKRRRISCGIDTNHLECDMIVLT